MTNSAQELNITQTELNGMASVLIERFGSQLSKGEITFPEAVRKAFIKYQEIQNDILNQLVDSPMEGNGITRKINQLSDIILDEVYSKFNQS